MKVSLSLGSISLSKIVPGYNYSASTQVCYPDKVAIADLQSTMQLDAKMTVESIDYRAFATIKQNVVVNAENTGCFTDGKIIYTKTETIAQVKQSSNCQMSVTNLKLAVLRVGGKVYSTRACRVF